MKFEEMFKREAEGADVCIRRMKSHEGKKPHSYSVMMAYLNKGNGSLMHNRRT